MSILTNIETIFKHLGGVERIISAIKGKEMVAAVKTVSVLNEAIAPLVQYQKNLATALSVLGSDFSGFNGSYEALKILIDTKLATSGLSESQVSALIDAKDLCSSIIAELARETTVATDPIQLTEKTLDGSVRDPKTNTSVPLDALHIASAGPFVEVK